MEEAETLSSRLAIMTKGGKLACQGSTLKIKNDYGQIFHIDLTLKAQQLEDSIDEADIECFSARNHDRLKTEIFAQVAWEKSEIVKMLKDRGFTHIAIQISKNGILSPKELEQDGSMIPAKELYSWYQIH